MPEHTQSIAGEKRDHTEKIYNPMSLLTLPSLRYLIFLFAEVKNKIFQKLPPNEHTRFKRAFTTYTCELFILIDYGMYEMYV